MNNSAMRQALYETVKPKFRGHKVLISKAPSYFPLSAEREYIRLVNDYMRELNSLIKQYLPEIKSVFKENKLAMDSILDDLNDIFMSLIAEWDKKDLTYGLSGKINKIALQTEKLSIADWKRQCSATLGINIFEDYYNGAFFQNIVPQWANNNVNLIKTIPKNTLNQMQNIIEEGFNSGTNLTKLSEKITQAYGINKRHALFIARDQIAKLNAQITQQQQSDAGVQEYIWDTSEDRRVRPYHAKLNGTRQKWSEPPIVDKNDRRCHPGEDYQCRCAALPVFDIDTLNVPWIPENSNIFGSLLTTGLINDTMNIDKANDFNQLSKALQDQYGVNINSDVEDLDFDTVKTALLGVDKILKEFPKAKSIFKGVGMTKAGIMSTSFDGDINFNSYYFEKGNPSAINAMLIGSANGKFPKNSSILTAGSHEAGHLLERALIEHGDYSMYSGGYAETLMKGDDWDKFTYSKKVISEACKAAKKTPSGKGITNPRLKRQVSEYATQNDSECLAECVQDYVANGDKATVLSKEVWKILKERLG